MTAWRAVAAVVCVAAACAPQIDVVAFQNDSGATPESGSPADASTRDSASEADTSPPPDSTEHVEAGMPDGPADATTEEGGAPAFCAPGAVQPMYLALKTLEIDELSPTTGMLTVLGVPDCAQKVLTEIVSMGVSPDGSLWLVDAAGPVVVVDPTVMPPACKAIPFKLAPSATTPARITFLPPPQPALAPPIYAYQSGELVVFDSRTFVQAPVGPFDATGLLGLSGTLDGRLYALRQAMAPNQAAISLVNPADGTIESTILTMLQAQVLTAGAYWGGSYYLFADQYLYFVLPLTGGLMGPMKIPVAAAVLAAASAPCSVPQ